MNLRRFSSRAWLACAAALLVGQGTFAAPPADKPAGKAELDEQAMMEIYMKAATAGPEHQELAKLVGNWKLDVTSWMAPGAPPQKSTGMAKFELLLGGRYLRQEVRGEMGGQPFEGIGIEGYDNVSKERFGMWFDSMGTGATPV